MKIYVNGKFLLLRVTGVERVANGIVEGLQKLAAEHSDLEVIIIRPPRWFAKTKLRPIFSFFWEQFILPLRARGGLLLSLCNTGPVLYHYHVLLMHDAAVFDVPENYSRRYVVAHRLLMRLHARMAAALFSVSNFSRKRLSTELGIPQDSIRKFNVGVDHIRTVTPDPTILERLGLQPKGYFLAIGSRQPGKNFPMLIKAAELADLAIPVVVAGGYNPVVFGARQDDSKHKFVEAGYVSDGELVSLLSNAYCYIQPSLYEGFGLPVIEAMALGVPVLCSNAASLPEVCGDAAIFFDPRDAADIAQTMSEFVKDPDGYRVLKEKAAAWVPRYSWPRGVAQLLTELRDIDQKRRGAAT
jgi:glycosyltransferase involved in cell wall biosynthesis